jgi:exodeoxyribonuclease V alpha subunit
MDIAGCVKELFDELDKSRILAVVRKWPFGVEHVNDLLLKEHLDPDRPPAGEPLVKSGIPVIVTKNSRTLDNGDGGVTVKRGNGDVIVLFPRGKGVVACPVSQLPEHELAYAVTVHKSQGSGYGDVLVVLPDDEDNPLLSRQLVYTGITRAKKRAVILGTEDALRAAIRNEIQRDTGIVLKEP